MPDISLRYIGPEGAEDMSAFACPLWRGTYDQMIGEAMSKKVFELWLSPDRIREMLGEGYRFAYVLVDGTEGGYIAFRLEESNTLYLSKIYLQPRFHGMGVGSAALGMVERIAREMGADGIRLYVNAANSRAIKAYERNGYAAVGRDTSPITEEFSRDDIEYALTLRRRGSFAHD